MKVTGRTRAACVILMLAILFSAAGTVAQAEQVLLNLNFSNSSGIYFFTQNDGQGQMHFKDGAVMVDVDKPGTTSWAVQLYTYEFQLVKGTSYELSWDMRSSVNRDILAGIQHSGGDWQTYAETTVRATNNITRFTFRFTMDTSESTPQLYFNLGLLDSMKGTGAMKKHQIFIDNVVLKTADSRQSPGTAATTGNSAPAESKAEKPTATPKPASSAASDQGTLFDQYAKPRSGSSNRLIENNHPAYPSIPSARSIAYNESFAQLAFSMAWYDLLEGELAQGIKINDTYAAEIYRGMTKKNVQITVAAVDSSSSYVNFIIAVLDKKADKATKLHYGNVYWIEWNSKDDKIRASGQYCDEDLYASWSLNAAGGNPILSRFPPSGSMWYEIKGNKKLQNELLVMYATKNNRKKPPIK